MSGQIRDASRIGQLLLAGGYVTRRQLRQALTIAERQSLPLCQVLLRQQRVERRDKVALLKLQKVLRETPELSRHDTAALGCRLGDILLANGDITQSQLNAALSEQSDNRKTAGQQMPLGALLLKRRWINLKQLLEGLRLQRRLIAASGVALAALATSSTCYASDNAAKGSSWGERLEASQEALKNMLRPDWRNPRFTNAAMNIDSDPSDEIFRSRDGKIVLRLNDTGFEFRKYF